MLRSVCEVLVGAEQNNTVPDAKLSDDSVDGADLYARSSAGVSQARCGNVVFAVWLDQCERGEALHDLLACLRARETLKQFLQDQAGGHDDIAAGKRLFQRLHLGFFNVNIASQRERPHARIDKQRHFRERSVL